MPESIRWTVLPDGTTTDAELRLTVLVTPRLTGGTTLGASADWPRTLARYADALQVEFRAAPGGASATVPTAPQPDRYPPPDSTLWRELFPTDTRVTAPTAALLAADAEPITLRSFPSRAVHAQITKLYENAATATAVRRAFPDPGGEGVAAPGGAPRVPPQSPPSWDHPQTDDLTTPLTGPVRDLARSVGASYQRLDRLIGRAPTERPGEPAAEAAAQPVPAPLHRPLAPRLSALPGRTRPRRGVPLLRPAPRAPRARRRTRPATAPPERSDLEFHAACALLADYPELLRRFGLALDLLVTPPPGLADQWQARVTFGPPYEGLDADESLRPWTRLPRGGSAGSRRTRTTPARTGTACSASATAACTSPTSTWTARR